MSLTFGGISIRTVSNTSRSGTYLGAELAINVDCEAASEVSCSRRECGREALALLAFVVGVPDLPSCSPTSEDTRSSISFRSRAPRPDGV